MGGQSGNEGLCGGDDERDINVLKTDAMGGDDGGVEVDTDGGAEFVGDDGPATQSSLCASEDDELTE